VALTTILLGQTDYRRRVAKEREIPLVNRYFETNPTNTQEQAALLARPRLKRWLTVGNGPIKGIYSQPGSFLDALFTVSEETLYRVDTTNVVTSLASGFLSGNPNGFVEMAATAAIGATPEMLYIADGQVLRLYMANSYALGVLTATGSILNNDTIEVSGVYYQWTNGSVNAGTPAGTVGSPWLVALGTTNSEALLNMMQAVSGEDGVAGTTYSTALVPNPSVIGRSSTASTLSVQARDAGAAGNLITTTETGANISWGGATLANGGANSVTPVPLPDDLPAVSVAFIAGFIIVTVGEQTNGFNGRFFWIEPGETFIRPLNFATAERSPDPVFSVRTVGDQFWLFGANTTEVWYPTGDETFPFARVQGQVFERGVIQGTDVRIKDSVMVVDSDGVVYDISGGGPRRVSNESIEERIRRAIKARQVGV
jgi:hypothetical protein